MLICAKEECNTRHHQLLRSIQTKNNSKAKRLLKKIKNCCKIDDSSGESLLHCAVAYRNAELVEHLVKFGCNVNAQDSNGYNPLMLAVQNHELMIVELLLKQKADIYLTNRNRESTLDVACRHCTYCSPPVSGKENSQLILEALFEKLNNDFLTNKLTMIQTLLNASDKLKFTILYLGSVKLTSFVLNNGFGVNYKTILGFTALHCAVMFAKLDNAKTLIAHGANVNALDRQGDSPLYYYTDMCQNEDEDSGLLKLLLKHSNNLIERDEYGTSKVERLLRYGNKKTVRTVLASGASFTALKFRGGKTLLHVLVENDNEHVLDVLVELNIQFDVNACDSKKETALMTAGLFGCIKKVEVLLANRTHVNMTAHEGESSVQNAVKCNKTQCKKSSKLQQQLNKNDFTLDGTMGQSSKC